MVIFASRGGKRKVVYVNGFNVFMKENLSENQVEFQHEGDKWKIVFQGRNKVDYFVNDQIVELFRSSLNTEIQKIEDYLNNREMD